MQSLKSKFGVAVLTAAALCGTAMAQKKPAAAKTATGETQTSATVIRGGKCLTVSHGTIDTCAVVMEN